MKVVVLHTGHSANATERVALLSSAARRQGFAFAEVETESADRRSLPCLSVGDAMYNATRGGLRLEESLWRPGVATIYAGSGEPIGLQDTTRWISRSAHADVPQPRTILHPCSDPKRLRDYVDFLGGLPIVIKVAGGTLGVGVMKVDSMPALLSLADHLVSSGTDFILREYVRVAVCLRIMVVGCAVVGALRYDMRPDDFRSNLTPADRPLVDIPSLASQAALRATSVVGLEVAGVDVAIDTDGVPLVLELNAPCGFASFDRHGVDVAGAIVHHLATKSGVVLERTE